MTAEAKQEKQRKDEENGPCHTRSSSSGAEELQRYREQRDSEKYECQAQHNELRSVLVAVEASLRRDEGIVVLRF
jgi:hypothetical protein